MSRMVTLRARSSGPVGSGRATSPEAVGAGSPLPAPVCDIDWPHTGAGKGDPAPTASGEVARPLTSPEAVGAGSPLPAPVCDIDCPPRADVIGHSPSPRWVANLGSMIELLPGRRRAGTARDAQGDRWS